MTKLYKDIIIYQSPLNATELFFSIANEKQREKSIKQYGYIAVGKCICVEPMTAEQVKQALKLNGIEATNKRGAGVLSEESVRINSTYRTICNEAESKWEAYKNLPIMTLVVPTEPTIKFAPNQSEKLLEIAYALEILKKYGLL